MKFFSIIAIYLIISLSFFTASTFARLDYTASGTQKVDNFARPGELITIETTSDSPVSFVTGTGTLNYKETPLEGCTDVGGIFTCSKPFTISSTNPLKTIPFKLKQETGTPLTIDGIVYIDSAAPKQEYLIVTKNGSGIIFDYNFTDYQYDQTRKDCKGSGIGKIELIIQGAVKHKIIITDTNNCSVANTFFADYSNTLTNTLSYKFIVSDRVGNKLETTPMLLDGDFKPPRIQNSLKILKDGKDVTEISSSSGSIVDIIVQIEDSNVTSNAVVGDLSQININPSINFGYKNLPAICTKDTGNVYNCIFRNVELRPSSLSIEINITATDAEGNIAKRTLTKVVNFKNNPGEVLYIGTPKDQCTRDLSKCYTPSGSNIFIVEVDGQSSYEKNGLQLGIDSQSRWSICRRDAVGNNWICSSIATVPQDRTVMSLFLAQSFDDYGNSLKSDIERTVYIDNQEPVASSELKVENSKNNNNCSVSGDELTLTIKVKESISEEVKISLNTSTFTTIPMQSSLCTKIGVDEFECKLKVTGFSSIPKTIKQDIIISDLAGNKLIIAYNFKTCKASSNVPPNVIYGFTQTNIPNIDRRTASIIPIKTYINGEFQTMSGSQLMYVKIDRCSSLGTNNMDVMSTGHYIIPGYGTDSTLVLNIGHTNAQLPLGEMKINCTISARINIGDTVYTSDEKETIELTVNTFNQPLGTLDDSTIKEIKFLKKELKDLDDSIERRKKFDNILGKICSLSEIMIKTNALLQTLKAAIYPISLALVGVGDLGQLLWTGFNTIASKFHSIVDSYIWPVAGSGKGNAIGWAFKYTCLIYNCRFYTMSGLIEISSDATYGVKKIQANTPIQTTCDDSNTHCLSEYRGGRKEALIKDENGKVVFKGVKYGDTRIYSEFDSNGKLISEDKIITRPAYMDLNDGFAQPDAEIIPSSSTKESKQFDQEGRLSKLITENSGSSGGKETDFDYTNNKYSTRDFIYTNPVLTPELSPNIVPSPTAGSSNTKIYGPAITGTIPGSTKPSGNSLIPGLPKGPVFNQVKSAIKSNYPNTYQGYEPDITSSEYWTAAQQTNLETLGQQGTIYSDIDRHDWIVNPYRSTHYDGMCAPATLYNRQKERQIKCMYLSCLKSVQNSGMPPNVCKDIYKVNSCLYLDSAQYRLKDELFGKAMRGVLQQTIMYATGYIPKVVYGRVCKTYSEGLTSASSTGQLSDLSIGWRFVGCGLFGSALNWREISALLQSPGEVMKNLFKGDTVKDPAEIYDYCEGGELYAE